MKSKSKADYKLKRKVNYKETKNLKSSKEVYENHKRKEKPAHF